MFNSKPNTSTLFGNSTSTPTSTPGPAQPSTNNPLFSQKPNGLFNNVNNANSIGTSTPSPSTGLFGNKPANISAPTTTTGGLFGSNNTQQTKPGGLFGNATSINTAAPSGGLFGNSTTNATAAPSSGLFGNATSNNQTSSGLFGAKPAAPTTGGLFGNSNTNTLGSTGGVSLFGNSATTGINNNSTAGNLFGNKSAVSGGLFGSTQTTTAPQPQSNPYGLNIGNSTSGVSSMPAPIIETLKKGTKNEIKTGTTHKSTAPKRSFSVSSNVPAPVTNVPHSNLFHKLNSRLNSVKNIASTKGIFSPSWSSHDYLKSNDLSNQRNTSVKDLATFVNGTGNVQELRRLKIDTARSAAKKIKLLAGTPVVTKSNSEEREETQNTEILDNDKNDRIEQSKEGSNIIDLTKVEESEKEIEDLESNTNSTQQHATDYWCSPSIESLSKLSETQLKTIPNFIIGRKGYGNISFNYDVDLSAFTPNLKDELFGKIVSFYSTKTVEVYPDHSNKPVVGSGLNVPATISLEKVYPIDKKTKKPITDASKTDEMQILIRKLKGMRDMEFISYNPFGGIWTFKVNHFSIWGLIDEEDAEIDEEDADSYKQPADDSVTDSIKPLSNRQLISTNPENTTTADFIMNESDAALNDGIVEEKQYEPDVMEQDFDALQVEPNLNISNDWINQLKLAGSNEHTIFVDEANFKTIPARITDVFNEFDNNLKADKHIIKSLKLKSNTNFSTVLYNNNILVKNLRSPSSVSVYSPESELGNKFNIQRELFQKHIFASVIEKRSNLNLPQVVKFDLKFNDILQVLPQTDALHDIWKLCSLLFDEVELPYHIDNDSVQATLLKQVRYNTLCSWLKNNMEKSLYIKKFDTTDPLDLIFVELMKNNVINATKLAISSNNKHLAVLVSYLGSNDPRVRELSDLQLSKWRSNGQNVDPKIERIYQLLSGELFGDENQISDLIDQYGWLSVFSLAIFYGQIDEMTLEEMVETQLYAIERSDNLLVSGIFEIFSQEDNVDSLLKKISIKSVNNSINVQFLWYLTQILVFKSHRNVNESLRDQVTSQYIDQLKLFGCSLESLYVALFINDNQSAKQTIESIIDHIIPTIWNEQGDRNTILEKLHLPKEIVYGSLALKEKYVGNYIKQTEYLIVGELFEEAAKLICNEVGPKLVLSYNQAENVQYLNILNEFIRRLTLSECVAFTKELSLFSEFVRLVSTQEGNNFSKQDIASLEQNVKAYYENNKHYKIIPACCNIISKRIQYVKTE